MTDIPEAEIGAFVEALAKAKYESERERHMRAWDEVKPGPHGGDPRAGYLDAADAYVAAAPAILQARDAEVEERIRREVTADWKGDRESEREAKERIGDQLTQERAKAQDAAKFAEAEVEKLTKERDAENKRAQEFSGAIWEAWMALKKIVDGAGFDAATIAKAALPRTGKAYDSTDKAEAQLAKVREVRDELDAKARDRRWVSDYRMALGRIVERIDAVLGEEENDAN